MGGLERLRAIELAARAEHEAGLDVDEGEREAIDRLVRLELHRLFAEVGSPPWIAAPAPVRVRRAVRDVGARREGEHLRIRGGRLRPALLRLVIARGAEIRLGRLLPG